MSLARRPVRRTAPRPKRAAGNLLGQTLRVLGQDLERTLPRVLGNTDSEAIHDMRVAIRKIRTVLKAARRVYGRFYADAVRAEFTVVHRSTGTLRDEEVFRETLAELDLRGPLHDAYRKSRSRREALLGRQARALVARGQVRKALDLLAALIALPVRPRRDVPAAVFAVKTATGAHKRTLSLRDTSTSDVDGLHDLRIAFKELRYSAELFASALPPDLRVLAEPSARFQKRLGEIHDCDMALGTITRARALPPAAKSQLLAALRALRARKVRKYVAECTGSEKPQAVGTASERKTSTR